MNIANAISGSVVLFFIGLFAFTKLVGPIPFTVSSVVTQKTDVFTVQGEGKSTVKPDIAYATAGFTTTAPTVKQAQGDLNTNINRVSDAIKKLGVDAKDIRTSNYSIYPTYDYKATPRRITGYSASSSLRIKVRALDRVNDIVDAATANGANEVGGISFDVEDKSKAENMAREEAIAEAKKKADVASKAAGFSLGRIINYSENFGGPGPVRYDMKAARPMSGGGTETNIETGSAEITVSVMLSYEIR